ncbi:MAG: undecaprenyldiphospho-muramoylpentapeptide beta-N-acetylglucosaminyltransferase [Armatimonadota bacterium]|nr:undecaprenyldiphospho-muramoylpentapeptide beta-N-acetylglucosaminyltransferase [Armatimonadota bacterium]MDR7458125.1 undecaprenyldiphospho-muramoylpentapeptide beta-N-acetylglucosaminyltransferase [Armatimonadota bacterium]MDR7495635.1 undecaprenyldiphospho-muramoylpentapeptide beta-N-acetylglucosaminyltransferase [Armatimonadota bacterium]
MRIVIAGGGTGGHIYPGLAIAEALRRRAPDVEVLFVGGRRLEAHVVPEAGWPFRAIAGRGLPRRASVGVIAALAAAALGGAQALALLWRWRPDAVVATGGYVCAPVGAAAVALGVPLVLQEQNVRAGLANRVLARWARWVSLPHPEAAASLPARAATATGVPLRQGALRGDRARAQARWGLEADRFTVLVLGGSQGARSLNAAICRLGDLLMYDARLQVLHQTGAADLETVRRAIGHREHVGPPALRHLAAAFLDPIGDAYACADLVVCRAGASTLAEVTAWGLPAILVPYPHAATGHQDDNAAVLARAGAALVIADHALAGTALLEAVRALLDNPPRRAAMAAASRALGRPDAADVVAGRVLALARAARGEEVPA